MEKRFDCIVVGGSVSGLLCAREMSRSGLSVAVLEEDYEIGTPEHCGGLVSLDGLRNLGIIPSNKVILNEVTKAKILSPTKGFEVSANRDKITVLDRRELDKQIAFQAQKLGSDIRTKSMVTSISYDRDQKEYGIKTKDATFYSEFFIDARGITSLLNNNNNRNGVLQSAQYEVYADWILPDEIIVKFDKVKYPDFFAWIIPSGNGKGKIGVAGRKINTLQTLESFIESFSSKYSIIRKIYAPIWIGGPLKNFVFDTMVLVGDAAGQTKPTTAGGIFSCGMGGILAGSHIALSKKNTPNSYLLNEYEKKWYSIFGKEFHKMLFFRKIMERLDNKSIDAIFSLISDTDIAEISQSATFDFHSFALSKILGSKKAIRLMSTLLGNEFRHILN